jgi:Rrf2 family nitric oxide-sensitive transcriptional repressor
VKLTTFTDYSLRVLIYLVAAPERRATIAEICAAYDVKANHLTKVVHHLGRRGWIATTRGKGGGLRLAQPAREIRVGAVVRDCEGRAKPAECFGTEESHCVIVRCCGLKGALEQAVEAFYMVLDRYTLADIASNGHELFAILHFRPPPPRASTTLASGAAS